MSNARGWIVLIGSLLALPGSTPQGLAQAARAELTGQVTAPDGAALPGRPSRFAR